MKSLPRTRCLPLRILGRPKHLYSIYKKLLVQNIPLERVYDKVAFRIILNTVENAMRRSGWCMTTGSRFPGRIKDFICAPKANNYQSLHTTVVGPHDNLSRSRSERRKWIGLPRRVLPPTGPTRKGRRLAAMMSSCFRDLKKLVHSLQEVEDPREFLETCPGTNCMNPRSMP